MSLCVVFCFNDSTSDLEGFVAVQAGSLGILSVHLALRFEEQYDGVSVRDGGVVRVRMQLVYICEVMAACDVADAAPVGTPGLGSGVPSVQPSSPTRGGTSAYKYISLYIDTSRLFPSSHI